MTQSSLIMTVSTIKGSSTHKRPFLAPILWSSLENNNNRFSRGSSKKFYPAPLAPLILLELPVSLTRVQAFKLIHPQDRSNRKPMLVQPLLYLPYHLNRGRFLFPKQLVHGSSLNPYPR